MASAAVDRIQMSCLGRYGRFANALIQYAFLKTYARRYGLSVEVPPWVGKDLFGTADAPLGSPLPKLIEKNHYEAERSLILTLDPPPRNVDLQGFYQYNTSYYRADRDYIRALFTPTAAVLQRVEPAASRLRRLGKTVVGIHLRRGDYGRGMFYITPTSWYRALLAELWPTLSCPALFVASEDPQLLDDFAEYEPETKDSLGVDRLAQPMDRYNYRPYERKQQDLLRMDFYPDFYLLSQCDVLLMPNSTFGFCAGLLSTRLQQAFRSHLPTQSFRPVDVWNAVPLEVEHHAESYRHIPGVCLDSSPWW